jgi:hypothetical protein
MMKHREGQKTNREADPADELPGLYTDAYTLFWWAGRIRIAFAEYLNEEMHYRTAIVMPVEDAESLAKDILDAVEKARKPKEAS